MLDCGDLDEFTAIDAYQEGNSSLCMSYIYRWMDGWGVCQGLLEAPVILLAISMVYSSYINISAMYIPDDGQPSTYIIVHSAL